MTKTILITGASTGIGAATARACVKAGWNVVLAARSKDKIDSLQKELGDDHALAVQCDVTVEDEVRAMMETAAGFGTLSAVFANAGLGVNTPGSENGNTAEWRQMVDTNIWGLLLTARYALPHLRKVEGGTLLLTGSRAGRNFIKGSVYGATKWFVHGYAENLSLEMAEWGGRCTIISPGMVNTPFFDEEKPDALQPEDVANAIVYTIGQPAHVQVGEVHLKPV